MITAMAIHYGDVDRLAWSSISQWQNDMKWWRPLVVNKVSDTMHEMRVLSARNWIAL